MKPATKLGAAAALLLALAPQSAAAALAPSGPAPAASAVTLTRDRGNVTAVVPGSAVGPGDGLDGGLRRGKTYRAEFVVWVAPNVAKANLVLHARGAQLHCTAERVRPGTTSAVICLVRTDANTSVRAVSIDVVVQTSNFGTFSRTFTHALTG